MITAIDTNILLDILIPNTKYGPASKTLLDKACREGALVINEVVYAELATQFANQKELDGFLQDTGIRLEVSSPKALHRTAEAWKTYSLNRDERLECPECGYKGRVKCPQCGASLARRHIISDFLIGGHAEVQADTLATRDRGYYKTYFQALELSLP